MPRARDRGVVVNPSRIFRWAALACFAALAAVATLPASASAAPCVSGSTSWGGGNGSLHIDANWSNGGPSAACDVLITAAGTYTVSMTGGANMKSLTLGGPSGTQTLSISNESPNTNLNANGGASSIGANAAVVLTCPGVGCNGPGLNFGGQTVTNAGTITALAPGGGSSLTGSFVNTGIMQFDGSATQSNGTVVNQGQINIADGRTFSSNTSHCGDSTGAIVKNDAGGSINAAGSGTLSAINYEQGAGTTSGTLPVQLPCGSLKYTGNGASSVQANGGFNLSGEMQPGQSLIVNAASSNTNATLTSDFVNKGSITLTCPVGCSGGSGGAGFNAAGKAFTNAGTFTVAAASGTGASIGSGLGGTLTNTGTMHFNQTASVGGVLINKGPINIADGKTVTSPGSSCGDAGGLVKNDTGGQINATGTGTFNIVTNYEQGAGTTSGTIPVQLPCGAVKYTGNGASSVQANGGFNLSGEMQPGQSLIVNAASSNTNATLTTDFVNKGSITLTCPDGGCSGGPNGGPGFNANGKAFVNAGTLTVAAAAGTGTGTSNGMTNTGTINVNQSAFLSGVVTNQGEINIADGKMAISTTGHCGDSGPRVINDTGGEINGTGTGTLKAVNYEQGAGTTSGPVPVSVDCGALKYIGTGASSVRVISSATLTGNIGNGQTVRVPGTLHSTPFSNAGTIALEGGALNTSALTNAGRLVGAGTVSGSVDSSGAVAPGTSPGTLTINGNYTQGAGGSLEIEVEGTGAGQFDKLAIGGNATLGGTLALQPSAGYAISAAIGDSVAFLSYGGTRANQFAQTTSNPPLACPKQFTATYNDGPKNVSADISNSASCGGGGGGSGGTGGGDGKVAKTTPVAPRIPVTVLKTRPRTTVKTKKAKAKVTFAFSSDVTGSTFQCKLDKGAFALCSSRKSYKVKPGKHKFTVKAIGPSGAADPTPLSFSFKVVKEKG